MEKKSVIFLAIPEGGINSLIKKLKFEFDRSILLPVELESAEQGLKPDKLTMETIITGMLRVISVRGRSGPLIVTAQGKKQAAEKASELSTAVINNGEILSGHEMSKIPLEWVDYYRSFVLTVKPEIYHEFTGATIVKASNGEFDMALEISNILEGLFPGSPGVLLNKALILENKAALLAQNGHPAEKENAGALEAYEAVLAMEPVLPDSLFNAGFFFMRQKDFIRAKDCFSRYVRFTEEFEESQLFEEKIKKAKNIIEDIVNQGLDDISFMEAHDCLSRGDDEKGILKIREFIEKNPKAWNGWFVLGWGLRKLGRYSDGLEALNKAFELGSAASGCSNCDILNEMAICLMELGDLKSARKKLEIALQEEPENIKIISNLGILAMKTGKKDEASAFFRTVLELDPNDPIAKHYLS